MSPIFVLVLAVITPFIVTTVVVLATWIAYKLNLDHPLKPEEFMEDFEQLCDELAESGLFKFCIIWFFFLVLVAFWG